MTTAQRNTYFALWPKACAAQGWNTKDEARRRAVTTDCMRLVRGPVVKSSADLGEDEITALFLYLRFLASGDADLDLSARWLDCQTDYHAFSRAQQADWHERETYGTGKNKLDRDRFDGETSAKGGPLDKFNPEAIRKRHLTMANRHAAKLKREKGQKPAGQTVAAPMPAFPIGGGTAAPETPSKGPAADRTSNHVEEFDAANPFG